VWKQGERAAEKYLKRRGIRTIERNIRLPHGEIDLLCVERRSGTIVVVEVKARKYAEAGAQGIDPTANITARKRAKLVSLAKSIKKVPRYQSRPIRIDVVSVRFVHGQRLPEIRHYPGCVSDS
tara:strand:+ start:3709 stop:4077 length:369 start_codon:yes stop_codon:yes gene_type:complete